MPGGRIGTNHGAQRRGDSAEATEGDAAAEITKLRTELAQLRGRLPDQSHVVKDVGFQSGRDSSPWSLPYDIP